MINSATMRESEANQAPLLSTKTMRITAMVAGTLNVLDVPLADGSAIERVDRLSVPIHFEAAVGVTTPTLPVAAAATDQPVEAEEEEPIPAEYQSRLAQLEQFAEDEGEAIDAASMAFFAHFIAAKEITVTASVILNNANHVCAKWWDSDSDQDVRVEFVPDGSVFFMIRKDSADGTLTIESGRAANSSQFLEAVAKAGLRHLLFS